MSNVSKQLDSPITDPNVEASTYSASEGSMRVVFVTRFAKLRNGESLSYHLGPASFSSVTNQSSCSASSSQLLRTYTGVSVDAIDIVYASDLACMQYSVVPTRGEDSTMEPGYYVQTFGTFYYFLKMIFISV